MDSISLPGMTAIIGEQQGFRGLAIRVDQEPKYGQVITTYWRPDADEIADIVAGKPIVIRLNCIQHPPITVDTKDMGMT